MKMDTILIQTLQKRREALPNDNTDKALRLDMLLGGFGGLGGANINMVPVGPLRFYLAVKQSII